MKLPRGSLSELGPYAASLAALQGSRFAFSVAAAAVIPPPRFTLWVLVLASAAYLPMLTLGTLNGVGRELPYRLGMGDAAGADRAEAVVWRSVAIGVAAIGAAGAVLINLFAADAAAIAAVLALTLVYQAQQATLRARLRFGRASIHQVGLAFAVGFAIVPLALAPAQSLAAVAGLYACSLAAAIALGAGLRTPMLRSAGRGDAVALVRIGLPIAAAGTAFALFATSDRWIAAALLGTSDAAPYAVASIVGSALLVVPTAVSQQMYPRMAVAWGEAHDLERVLALARRQGAAAAATGLPLALGVAVGGFWALPRFLPEYDGAALPAALVTSGVAAQSLFTGYGNVLNVVGAHRTYLGLQVAAIAVAVALMAGGALIWAATGVATGVAAASLAYGAALRWAALRVASDRARAESRVSPRPDIAGLGSQ